MPAPPRIVRPEERESGAVSAAGGDVYANLATGAETDGSYYLQHAIVPAGGGGLAHIHTREEEAFYVIRGDLEFLVGDERVTVGPGTFLNVPKGTKHQFHNASDQEAEMIFWFAPAGIEGLFRELGENPQDIVAIGKKYGVEYFFD